MSKTVTISLELAKNISRNLEHLIRYNDDFISDINLPQKYRDLANEHKVIYQAHLSALEEQIKTAT